MTALDACLKCGRSRGEGPPHRKFCSRDCQVRWTTQSRRTPSRSREANREAVAEWRRRNPDRARLIARLGDQRRRARMRGAGVFIITKRDWDRLVRRHAGRCAYCGRTEALTIDHVVPIAKGGRHSIGNLLLACRRCNFSKSDRLLIVWRHRQKKQAEVAAA